MGNYFPLTTVFIALSIAYSDSLIRLHAMHQRKRSWHANRARRVQLTSRSSIRKISDENRYFRCIFERGINEHWPYDQNTLLFNILLPHRRTKVQFLATLICDCELEHHHAALSRNRLCGVGRVSQSKIRMRPQISNIESSRWIITHLKKKKKKNSART